MSRGGGFAFRLATPGGRGAIAVIDLHGDVEEALASLGVRDAAIGAVALRNLGGVDTGLVVRWSESFAQVTPHAGPFVVQSILGRLAHGGGETARDDDPRRWPEAADVVEARTLWALSRARSPRAVDLLLAQPRRWRTWDGRTPAVGEVESMSRMLDRLIEPPLVVALGAPNIGKSTLVNALAGRDVALVADEPGVTRDHVGVALTLDGLTVRWVDTPGLRTTGGEVEREAINVASIVASGADLLALCADAGAPFPDDALLASIGLSVGAPVVRVGLRADRGETPGADVLTAAGAERAGLADLAQVVRRRLVTDAALTWQGPWAMGGASPDSLQGGGGSPTLACSDR